MLPVTSKKLLGAAAAVSAAVLLSSCASSSSSGSMSDMAMGSAGPSASAPAAGGASGQRAASHNAADIMFAQMMIPHHAQAIRMSEVLLAKSGVPQPVLDLARQIKSAQAPEIERMTGWLRDWNAEVPDPASTSGMQMGGSDGLMSQQDMDALERADGTQAATLFLTQMIEHHQGAITMAEQEQAAGQDDAAKALASSVVSTQQGEIDTMKKLLAAR